MSSATVQHVLKELGHRVKDARRVAGLTQEAAAERAGIDVKHWQRIERGMANVTVRTIVRVATALGVSYWDLKKS